MSKKKKKKKKEKVTSKKPAASTESKKRGPRKGTRIAFLREIYAKDQNIANDKILQRLLAKFPESKADVKSIVTWKKMLRDEGMDIPLQRAGAKAGAKKAKTDEKKSKKKSKKKRARK